MNLMEAYQRRVASDHFELSSQQMDVLTTFEQISKALPQTASRALFRRKKNVMGLYLYGAVGSGKTFLMDLFFEHAPVANKLRFHFHHWMQTIDTALRHLQGTPDPLHKIADDLAEQACLICIDEFMVHDPAQAMLLVELLDLLFQRGIVLVATSNLKPDDLYLDGFQRERFLKAIDLIKMHCYSRVLDTGRDYRLNRNTHVATFLVPDNPENQDILKAQFQKIAPDAAHQGVLTIQNRLIPFIQCGETAVWFDFQVLCHMPRSQLDYLEIAERFDTVFLSAVPVLSEKDIIPAILLMHLVDVLYDRRIRLVMIAAAPVEALLQACEQELPCQRTISRLIEMQSWLYPLSN